MIRFVRTSTFAETGNSHQMHVNSSQNLQQRNKVRQSAKTPATYIPVMS